MSSLWLVSLVCVPSDGVSVPEPVVVVPWLVDEPVAPVCGSVVLPDDCDGVSVVPGVVDGSGAVLWLVSAESFKCCVGVAGVWLKYREPAAKAVTATMPTAVKLTLGLWTKNFIRIR
jgi:hypothetical protein